MEIDPTAWIAPGAVVVGRVTLGARASVWFNAVLRSDHDEIVIGPETNLQDGVVAHADPGFPVRLGARVTVGHRAVLHGCTIDDDVLVGMGAIVMNGAHVGSGSIVGAGALLPEGFTAPPGSLILGMPAKLRRPLTEPETARIPMNAASYVTLADEYRARES